MRGCVPPRSHNLAKFLRNHHQEQVDKLLLKNQIEVGIVEDIRSFVKQKCLIEKCYAESLLKLSSNFQNKKQPNIPDIETSTTSRSSARSDTRSSARSDTRRVSLSGDSLPTGGTFLICF